MPNDIDPFIAEPSLRVLAHRNIKAEWLLLPAALTVAAFVLVSIQQGTFYIESPLRAVCQDVAHLARSSKVSCLTGEEVPASMPLQRDWPSLILMVAAVLTPYLVYKQWLGFAQMVPTLRNLGLVLDKRPGVSALSSLDAEIARMNSYFTRFASSSIIPAAVAALAMGALVVGSRRLIYQPFAPPDDPSWSTSVGRTWWAGLDSGGAGWLLYFMTGFVAVFYIVRMNMVGSRVVFGLWRIRKQVLFGVDLDNVDGEYGWKPVTQVLSATWAAILLHGLGILCLMLLLDVPSWVLLVPLLGQWLVVLPFYSALPIVIVVRDVRAFRKAQESAMVTAISAVPQSDVAQRAVLAQRLASIRKLPLLLPFRKWWTARGFIVAVGGAVASLWAAAAVFWDINIFS